MRAPGEGAIGKHLKIQRAVVGVVDPRLFVGILMMLAPVPMHARIQPGMGRQQLGLHLLGQSVVGLPLIKIVETRLVYGLAGKPIALTPVCGVRIGVFCGVRNVELRLDCPGAEDEEYPQETAR